MPIVLMLTEDDVDSVGVDWEVDVDSVGVD